MSLPTPSIPELHGHRAHSAAALSTASRRSIRWVRPGWFAQARSVASWRPAQVAVRSRVEGNEGRAPRILAVVDGSAWDVAVIDEVASACSAKGGYVHLLVLDRRAICYFTFGGLVPPPSVVCQRALVSKVRGLLPAGVSISVSTAVFDAAGAIAGRAAFHDLVIARPALVGDPWGA